LDGIFGPLKQINTLHQELEGIVLAKDNILSIEAIFSICKYGHNCLIRSKLPNFGLWIKIMLGSLSK